MKINLQMLTLSAAVAASLLAGCSSPNEITARTDPNRPSYVQTQEGYDTFGRKWDDQTTPAATSTAQTSKPKGLSRSDYVLLNLTGTITDIDHSSRQVTLRGSQGRIETFVVDKSVKRFNEAKVGDKVSLDYYLGYNAEVRKPTAEEQQNPLVMLEATGREGPNAAPAGVNMRQIRAVVTIEGLDRQNQTLTVKGPRGKHFVARVADPSRLDEVHIGETIVLTFTAATAVSLEPAN